MTAIQDASLSSMLLVFDLWGTASSSRSAALIRFPFRFRFLDCFFAAPGSTLLLCEDAHGSNWTALGGFGDEDLLSEDALGSNWSAPGGFSAGDVRGLRERLRRHPLALDRDTDPSSPSACVVAGAMSAGRVGFRKRKSPN